MKKLALIIISLFVTGWAMAQTGTHWSPIGGTQYNMTVKGIIVIDGVTQANNQLEIGAFCGDECRGSRKAALFPPTGEYPVMLTVVSNVFSGETITFRIYDHTTQQELDLVSESTLVFEHNTNQGAMNNWFPFVFTSPEQPQPQTFTMDIAEYGTSAGGYYLIAPPFDGINPEEISGMTDGEFDLYYFDQSEGDEWRNYKANPFAMRSGKGYLYAHQTDVSLSFTGQPYNGNGEIVLDKTEGVRFSGWNLVGNPFTQAATIDRDCYVMNANGSEVIPSDSRTVSPMQGVFVIASVDGESMTFSPGGGFGHNRQIVVDVLQGRSPAAIDRAILRFEGGGSLPKFMLNPDNTRVYIPQDGADYAVAGSNIDNTSTLCFKAGRDGSYTLGFNLTDLDLDYLHLVDNKTGADVDLLTTPNYTFDALTTDFAERFKLVYATTTGVDEGESPFAYYADGEIHLFDAGESASLQIVDMTGRMVYQGDAMHRVSTDAMVSGVYMLRLVSGNDVKVQKVVVGD